MFGLLRSKKEKHAEEANMQTKQNVRSGDKGNAPKRHHGGPVAQLMKAQALVINCGSSSLKYGVFEIHSETDATLLASGLVEKIGLDMGAIKHEVEGRDKQVIEMPIPTHDVGLEKVVELLLDGVIADKSDVKVVGHRVVHGGDKFTAAALLDAEAKAAIQEAAALAPLHNPANLMGIDVCEKLFPVPQVAVFDTAFHMTMGPEAYLYALPIDLYVEASAVCCMLCPPALQARAAAAQSGGGEGVAATGGGGMVALEKYTSIASRNSADRTPLRLGACDSDDDEDELRLADDDWCCN